MSLASLCALHDASTIETLQKRLNDLNAQLKILIDEGIKLRSGLIVGTPEAAENRLARQNENTQRQNDIQAQINSVTLELNQMTSAAESAATKAAQEPSARASADREVIAAINRQGFLYNLPGRYDYGAGSSRRNAVYKQENLGGNMSRILDLDRPTMGFDIWSVVAQGVQKGAAEVRAAGQTPVLPKFQGVTGVSLPNVALPAWLTSWAKPAQTIAKNVLTAAQAAKEKDAREAAARAGAVGSSVTSYNPSRPSQAGMSPTVLVGLGATVVAALYLSRSRR